MKRSTRLLAVLLLLGLSGCVSQYEPPKKGEPAALVKLKYAYDHQTASRVPPPGGFGAAVSVSANLVLEEDLYRLYSKSYGGAFSSKSGAPLEIHGARIHPGKPVTFHLGLSVTWQTRKMEWVTEETRKPKQVMKTERVYNSRTRSYDTRTRYVTEYEIERKQVQKMVTRNHSRGCNAGVVFTPLRDAAYLLDYSNPEITSGCTLQAYLQTSTGEGKFKLEQVGSSPPQKK